jgi:hypothetical protein
MLSSPDIAREWILNLVEAERVRCIAQEFKEQAVAKGDQAYGGVHGGIAAVYPGTEREGGFY